MKDLRAVKGTYYIHKLIAEGEHEHQDFKFAISDARKIARSISAFANNDGGRLLVGVKDNGTIAGVRNEEDIYVIEQAASMFCRPEQPIHVTAYRVDGGAIVFQVEIARAEKRPVEVREEDGVWKAYFRVADENIAAPPFMTRAWSARNERSGFLLSLTGPERVLLEALEAGEALTPADFARRARITVNRAVELIAHLHALDLVDFRYGPGGFKTISRQ